MKVILERRSAIGAHSYGELNIADLEKVVRYAMPRPVFLHLPPCDSTCTLHSHHYDTAVVISLIVRNSSRPTPVPCHTFSHLQEAWNERSRQEGTPLQRYFEQFARARAAEQRVQANDTIVIGRREREQSATAAGGARRGVLSELFRAHELGALARDGQRVGVASEEERLQFPALFGREALGEVGGGDEGDDEELLQLLAASDDEDRDGLGVGAGQWDGDGEEEQSDVGEEGEGGARRGRPNPSASSGGSPQAAKRRHKSRQNRQRQVTSSKRRR